MNQQEHGRLSQELQGQLTAISGYTAIQSVHVWLPEGQWDPEVAPFLDAPHHGIVLNMATRQLLRREGYVPTLAYRVTAGSLRANARLDRELAALADGPVHSVRQYGGWVYVYVRW